jgi:hypoxanthine phosphoribosyltransferase
MNEPAIERILFTEEQIDQRVRQVAADISAKYSGRELKLIGVLKGSVFFLTALAREITVPTRLDFLAISSFANQRGGPGMVRIAKDLDDSIEGDDVILVEDIVDTGFTTRYLLQHLAGRGPNSLALCTLLDRTPRRIVQVPVDYRCFEIPDRFVVGFGLDHKQLYRNLKYIAVLNLDEERVRGDPRGSGIGVKIRIAVFAGVA